MKRLAILLFALTPFAALAQDVIPETTIADSIAPPLSEKARRAAIRKERNKLEIGAGLLGTLTSFNNTWIKTSGGDNSIGIAALGHVYHTYTKDKFSLESKFEGKFGYNRMNVVNTVTNSDGIKTTTKKGTWFKYQDEFVISTAPAYAISKNWALASIIRFRSQFAKGYVSRSQQGGVYRKSSFMAPGFFDMSVGFTYTCPDPRWPVKVNISPLALSAVFVESSLVRSNISDGTTNGRQGWEALGLAGPHKTSKWEGGSSVQVDFDRTFDKKGIFRYRTTFYAFMGWISDLSLNNRYTDSRKYDAALTAWKDGGQTGNKPMLAIHPTVRWVNTIDIKATKFLTTSFYFQLFYDRSQNYDLQTQMLLSVGLTYTFNNK